MVEADGFGMVPLDLLSKECPSFKDEAFQRIGQRYDLMYPGNEPQRQAQQALQRQETPTVLSYIRFREGRIFFANADWVGERMRPLIADAKPKVGALDLSGVPDLEYTALKMLTEAEKRLRERGTLLGLVGLNPEVLRIVQNSELGETLGRERMSFNLEQAVEKYQRKTAAGRLRARP